jgi:asparagine synthase (glutamine-hydrolysing)
MTHMTRKWALIWDLKQGRPVGWHEHRDVDRSHLRRADVSGFSVLGDSTTVCAEVDLYSDASWCLDENNTIDVRCLWSGGFIANRAELCNLVGAEKDISDARLVAALYLCRQTDAIALIEGTFACVLCDVRTRTLIIVRDRVGVNGLYYATVDDHFFVSGQVDVLLDLTRIPSQLNKRSIVAQIHGFTSLEGETFYEDVLAVPPAVILTICNGQVDRTRYWRLEPEPALKLRSDEEYASAYRELLFHVVNQYTPAIGVVGVTLTSGLDSTNVAAALRELLPASRIHAFSWITPEIPEADESRLLADLWRQLAIPSMTVRADLCWPLSQPEGLCADRSSPTFGFYSEIWAMMFATVKATGVDVLMSGITGDHLFGEAIPSYPDLFLTGHWVALFQQLQSHRRHSPVSMYHLVKWYMLGPIAACYAPWLVQSRARAAPWLHRRYVSVYDACLGQPDRPAGLLPGRQQRLNLLRDRNLPRIVEILGGMGAAYGVECRHPLTDHRLMEFAARLPTHQSYRGGLQKVIMRQAMRGLLPDTILNQRTKIVPSALGEKGLKEMEREKVWKLLTNMRAAELGYVDEDQLQQNYREYLAGNNGDALFWHTLCLEDWLRRYF